MNLIKELQEKKGFSDSERTIADYLLRHSRLLPSMTTRQLAKKTYTSSAAIVRFCQKLGFGGYTEFRVEFLAQMIQYIESPYGMELSMTDRDAVHSILEKVTRLEIDAMQETYRMLDPADFVRAFAILQKTSHIDFYAMDNNLDIANMAASGFIMAKAVSTNTSVSCLGINTLSLTKNGSPMNSVLPVRYCTRTACSLTSHAC